MTVVGPEARAAALLRAPTEQGAWLVEPRPGSAPCIAPVDQSWREEVERVSTLSLQQARAQTVDLAWRYTLAYRDRSSLDRLPLALEPGVPVVLAGHQPQWFHPGVWFKNGVLDRLAQGSHAIPINLIIDNDLCTSAHLRFPAGSLDEPHWDTVPLDRAADAIPFEQREVLDEQLFESAERALTEKLPDWMSRPLVHELFAELRAMPKLPRRLGERLAAARHRFEARWKWQTLELPLSQICETRSFHVFAARLWSDAARLRDIYNQALRDHRLAHRIRSRSHPVPELEERSDWTETPFWIWSDDAPRRRRLFVQVDRDQLALSDQVEWSWRGSLSEWLAADESILPTGVKIRSRALITTWYARAFLCDRFVHGIGGAHYDQLTDEIVRRFWGVQLPAFTTATATLRLPQAPSIPTAEQWGELKQSLRALDYHPEAFVTPQPRDGHPLDHECVARKQHWVEMQRAGEPLTDAQRRARHVEIAQANECLQQQLAIRREELLSQRAQWEHQTRNHRVLGSRELSLALHHEQTLSDAFEKMLSEAFGNRTITDDSADGASK